MKNGEAPDLTPQQILISNNYKHVYSAQTKTFNLEKIQVSDLIDNPRICLPKERPTGEEAHLAKLSMLTKMNTAKMMD